jgi:acyl-CoA synthetase (AMP-forming)/AMP-acid ligase II
LRGRQLARRDRFIRFVFRIADCPTWRRDERRFGVSNLDQFRKLPTSSRKTLPIGTTGEFCTRGYHVMLCYFEFPEATAAAIDADGWPHTGDLCTMDARGYCTVEGRLKDMIIRGGENICPRELEELLFQQPAVAEVAVIGVPHEKWGEEVAAFIRPVSALRTARALLTRFRPGERIAVWAQNIPEWIMLAFGAGMAGMVLVTVNLAFRAREVEYVLKQSRSSGVFVVSAFRGNPMLEIVRAVAPNCPNFATSFALTTGMPRRLW